MMPKNLDGYLKSRRLPENVNLVHRSRFKFHDRVAAVITAAIGSMYAVYFFIVFVLGWMIWQVVVEQPFDPYPFVFMIFISNVIQLILLPLILVGQNVQNRHNQLRAEEEYQTTKTIHQDIETILTTLDSLTKK